MGKIFGQGVTSLKTKFFPNEKQQSCFSLRVTGKTTKKKIKKNLLF